MAYSLVFHGGESESELPVVLGIRARTWLLWLLLSARLVRCIFILFLMCWQRAAQWVDVLCDAILHWFER